MCFYVLAHIVGWVLIFFPLKITSTYTAESYYFNSWCLKDLLLMKNLLGTITGDSYFQLLGKQALPLKAEIYFIVKKIKYSKDLHRRRKPIWYMCNFSMETCCEREEMWRCSWRFPCFLHANTSLCAHLTGDNKGESKGTGYCSVVKADKSLQQQI